MSVLEDIKAIITDMEAGQVYIDVGPRNIKDVLEQARDSMEELIEEKEALQKTVEDQSATITELEEKVDYYQS